MFFVVAVVVIAVVGVAQAFEKPTQIYTWLSVRHAVNPTFLNRTLSYMRARDRPRRDAYAKRRKSFKLQDLYERSVEEETRKKVTCVNV